MSDQWHLLAFLIRPIARCTSVTRRPLQHSLAQLATQMIAKFIAGLDFDLARDDDVWLIGLFDANFSFKKISFFTVKLFYTLEHWDQDFQPYLYPSTECS